MWRDVKFMSSFLIINPNKLTQSVFAKETRLKIKMKNEKKEKKKKKRNVVSSI